MIVLDTSVLVDALCGDMDSEPAIRRAVSRGEQIAKEVIYTLVLLLLIMCCWA